MKSNSIGQFSIVAMSLAGLTISSPANAATLYNAFDLGVAREAGSTTATGINDLGQVIGISFFNKELESLFGLLLIVKLIQ